MKITFTSDIHHSFNCHKCKINDVGGETPKNESLANIIVSILCSLHTCHDFDCVFDYPVRLAD